MSGLAWNCCLTVAFVRGAEALLEAVDEGADVRGRGGVGGEIAEAAEEIAHDVAGEGEEPAVEAALRAGAHVVDVEKADVGTGDRGAADDLADRALRREVDDAATRFEAEGTVVGFDDLVGPRRDGRRRRRGGSETRAQGDERGERVLRVGGRGLVDEARARSGRARLAADRGARLLRVDEAEDEAFVERVAEIVFERARALAPRERVGEPVFAVGDVRPDTRAGDAGDERFDVAGSIFQAADVVFDPLVPAAAVAHELDVELGEEVDVRFEEQLAEIGHGADVPEEAHAFLADGEARDVLAIGEADEGLVIVGVAHVTEDLATRAFVQRGLEGGHGRELEIVVAPADSRDAREGVRLDGVDDARGDLERRERAERAVLDPSTGAAGDLAELRVLDVADVLAVELAERGERDVLDVEVQAHADRVGGDEPVDLAGLEHRDLRVARARAERAEHDGRAALPRGDPIGDLVDVRHRERDDGASRREAGERRRAGVRAPREARVLDVARGRDELAQRGAHRLGAEQPGLRAPARGEDARREDVGALIVRGELHLVDRDEVDVTARRHRFDGADPIRRTRGDPPLFARDERDPRLADARADLVVDLAREQTQRQADHARRVLEHALDRPMGLARVRPSEQRADRARVRHWRILSAWRRIATARTAASGSTPPRPRSRGRARHARPSPTGTRSRSRYCSSPWTTACSASSAASSRRRG